MAFSVAQLFEKNNYQDLNLLFFFCQGGVCIENESKYCRRARRRQFIFGWLAAELHSSGRCQDWNGWELQHRVLFAAGRAFNQSSCYLELYSQRECRFSVSWSNQWGQKQLLNCRLCPPSKTSQSNKGLLGKPTRSLDRSSAHRLWQKNKKNRNIFWFLWSLSLKSYSTKLRRQ